MPGVVLFLCIAYCVLSVRRVCRVLVVDWLMRLLVCVVLCGAECYVSADASCVLRVECSFVVAAKC